jgi:hypothetical protein
MRLLSKKMKNTGDRIQETEENQCSGVQRKEEFLSLYETLNLEVTKNVKTPSSNAK